MQYVCSPPSVGMSSAPPVPPHLRPQSQDDLKRIAAHRAVEQVDSGMVIGLGTGSTAFHAIERIGELLRLGRLRDIVCIPTSKKTEAHALSLGIPLSDLNSHSSVDLSIDGADEVDPHLNLVKGRGGSLLREKMIESASRRFVVIVDESKLVERIGASGLAVPVEVVPFGWHLSLLRIKSVFEPYGGCEAKLRVRRGSDGVEVPSETDNLNYVVDLFFEHGMTADPDTVSDSLLRIPGVVEHGMFLGLATSVIVAGKDGVIVKTRDRNGKGVQGVKLDLIIGVQASVLNGICNFVWMYSIVFIIGKEAVLNVIKDIVEVAYGKGPGPVLVGKD